MNKMNRLEKLKRVHKLVGDLLDDLTEGQVVDPPGDRGIISKVVAVLDEQPKSAAEVGAKAGITSEQASQALARLVREQRAVRVQRGRYTK